MMSVHRNRFAAAAAAAVVLASAAACGSGSSVDTPLGPAPAATSEGAPVTPGAGLKASAPVVVAPANAATTSSLTPTLVVSGGGLTYLTRAVAYRFGGTDDAGNVAADSGLVSSATWTPAAPLTPTSRYTWAARSEYHGLSGPWSTASTFTTPVAPGNDYGSWESTCDGRIATALVECVWD